MILIVVGETIRIAVTGSPESWWIVSSMAVGALPLAAIWVAAGTIRHRHRHRKAAGERPGRQS
jgi:hypothetical protein